MSVQVPKFTKSNAQLRIILPIQTLKKQNFNQQTDYIEYNKTVNYIPTIIGP